MKRPRFGKDESAPTREELEREAARELERMTRQAGGPAPSGRAPGWSSAPPPPASSPSSYQPRFGGGGGAPGAPVQPSVRERFQAREVEEMDQEDDDEGDYSEEEMVTELALRDWSERSGRGRSIEDLALPRLDAGSVEAQRDRALREFTERQARMERETEAARIQRQAMGLTPPSRAGTVNLTAARPMGMLNLSAKAAGMRAQGSAPSSTTKEPTSEASPKRAKSKAKTAGTGRPGAGGSGAGTAKKAPAKAKADAVGGPAAKAAPRAAKTAPRAAKTSPVVPPAPVRAAKVASKPAAGKTATAGKTAKVTSKPAAEPVVKAAKAVGKAPKAVAKAVGKAPGASREREDVSTPSVTPAKKKKAPAAPAKASPSPRKGSGRR